MLFPDLTAQPEGVPLPQDLQMHLEDYLDGTLEDRAVIARIDEHVRHNPEVAVHVQMHLALHRFDEHDWDDVRH